MPRKPPFSVCVGGRGRLFACLRETRQLMFIHSIKGFDSSSLERVFVTAHAQKYAIGATLSIHIWFNFQRVLDLSVYQSIFTLQMTVFQHFDYQSVKLVHFCIYPAGAGNACWYSAGLVIERLRVWIPSGAAGEFSSPELTFCADSYSASVSSPCYRSGT